MAEQVFYGTGRRKSSVARVYLKPGQGRILVNNTPLKEYFPTDAECFAVMQPLKTVGTDETTDVNITVKGGGYTGQAGAIRHGISRALTQQDGETRAPLKKAGFLTRDARTVERKKYGQPGARKRFQYSKR